MSLTPSCRRQSPWNCGVFFGLVWLRPRFVLLRCFLCRQNANLAGRFACRRCCRVSCFCGGFSMVCLVCEAKGFHTFCTLLYRFSHCQDRALERDRPQQRGKKNAIEQTYRHFRNKETSSNFRFFLGDLRRAEHLKRLRRLKA